MISELPKTGPMSGSTDVQAYGGPMMGDTLTFQVSPSHLLDQPPKTYKQHVLMSKTQAVSSLDHTAPNHQHSRSWTQSQRQAIAGVIGRDLLGE